MANRILPKAVMVGLPLVTLCYVSVNIAFLTLMSPEEFIQSSSAAVVSNTLPPFTCPKKNMLSLILRGFDASLMMNKGIWKTIYWTLVRHLIRRHSHVNVRDCTRAGIHLIQVTIYDPDLLNVCMMWD